MSTCVTEGCTDTHYAKGLCKKHYDIRRSTEYRTKNKDKISKRRAKNRVDNKSKIAEQRAAVYVKNKDKILKRNAEYRAKHKAKIYTRNALYRALPERKDRKSKYNVEYRLANKDRIKKLHADRWALRYKTDYTYRITLLLRRRIQLAIKEQGAKKYYHSHEILGCTPAECNKYLESKFQTTRPNAPNPDCETAMTWENQGNDWHIDHIRPCSSFDLTDPVQQKACFHYTNLQPLWAEDNLKKSDKV